MSNNINPNTRSAFFPNTKKPGGAPNKAGGADGASSIEELKRSSINPATSGNKPVNTDARVDIPEGVKDFSKIKKQVDASAPIDNSEKIARLKAQIQNGTYQVDYDQLAEKMLTEY